MKLKRGLILGALAVMASGVTWLWLTPRLASPRGLDATKPAAADANGSVRPTVPSSRARATELRRDQFCDRFGLDQAAYVDLENALRAQWDEWRELRGSRAAVERFDGTTLVLRLPSLSLTAEEWEKAQLAVTERILGRELAGKIWRDTDGKRGVLGQFSRERLNATTVATFVKLNDGKFDQEAPHEQAEFAVRFEADAGPESSRVATIDRFCWSDWLAWGDVTLSLLRHAPTGYFARKPLPEPGSGKGAVHVVHNWDTGTAEIRNLREPGSRETVRVSAPERAPPKP